MITFEEYQFKIKHSVISNKHLSFNELKPGMKVFVFTESGAGNKILSIMECYNGFYTKKGIDGRSSLFFYYVNDDFDMNASFYERKKQSFYRLFTTTYSELLEYVSEEDIMNMKTVDVYFGDGTNVRRGTNPHYIKNLLDKEQL